MLVTSLYHWMMSSVAAFENLWKVEEGVCSSLVRTCLTRDFFAVSVCDAVVACITSTVEERIDRRVALCSIIFFCCAMWAATFGSSVGGRGGG